MIRYERDAGGDLWAVAGVRVGTERPDFRVPLGRWTGDHPGPGGLLGTPVVVLPDGAWLEIVVGAVAHAGRTQAREVAADGGALLSADRAEIGVLVVRSGNGRAMNVIRALGGRPLPALPFTDAGRVRDLLDGCHVDVDIAVPAVGEPRQGTIRDVLAGLHLEDVHHLVDVDPRPGLEAAGIRVEQASLDALGAVGAGVLAGRLAAAVRRWSAP